MVLLLATVAAAETHVGDWDVTGEITASGNFATFGDSSYVTPFSGWSGNSRMVAVRQPNAVSSGVSAGFMFSNNQTSGAFKNVAQLMFLNEAIVAADKRVAQILVTTGGSTDSGKMYIRMYDGGTGTNGLIIRKDGTIEGIKFLDGETQTTAYMGATGGGTGNTASGLHSTVGGGEDNTASQWWTTVGGGVLNTASGMAATVGGGGNITASGTASTVGGGDGHLATDDYGTIGGGYANQAGDGAGTTADAASATVAGGYYNEALAKYATIAGGGPSDEGNPTTTNNVVTDDYGTIGGGGGNQAGDDAGTSADAWYATVSGGRNNTASDSYATVAGGTGNTASANHTTVGGGHTNQASALCSTTSGGADNTASGNYGTIGGGYQNIADGISSTVGGGQQNTASGYRATVPGGWNSTASGDYSLAAGRSASATHNNSFVWGDSVGGGSAGADTFNIHASNGVYLNGALHAASDRNKKEHFEPVDAREVLKKVADLPMSSWSYKREYGGIRHMGPMGQDFYAAFALGTDDKHITTVDADGVALAAIQGLNQKLEEKDVEIGHLRQQNASLEARLAALEEAISQK
jgi:hypothetical protein